ncbi:glycosyltransferase 87 family protein, partial [Nocardioides zeicaulis]
MLHGTSPYAITIENPYDAAGTRAFYGPGVVVDGIVQYGFPYLPASLLLDVPAHLLGDPRWMHLAAVLLTTGLAWRMATDRLGRAVALLLVCGTTASTVVLAYWVEPLLAALLLLTVLAMRSGRTWAAVPLGLLFASKQYAVSYAPALVTVARSRGWRTVALAAAVGAVVVVPFVVWDPREFVRSVVELQFIQPFRDDAVSLLPGLKALLGGLPDWAVQVSPVIGLLVSALVAWRTRPGATAFAIGVALSLLVTVLTSKVGFMNYYYFIGAAF